MECSMHPPIYVYLSACFLCAPSCNNAQVLSFLAPIENLELLIQPHILITLS